MFDHLDDHEPPAPGAPPGAPGPPRPRSLLLRRRLVVGGSSTAALSLVLVVAMAIASSGSPGHRTSVEYLTDPPTVEVVSETPTPASTPSPTASATPSETPSPTTTPTQRASATATCEGFPAQCPDGKPGWGTGLTSCTDVSVPERPDTGPVAEGLTASLAMDPSAPSGSRLHGVVTLTNSTDLQLTVHYGSTFTRIEVDGAASYGTDAFGIASLVVEPHSSADVAVEGATVQCGDTPSDDEPGLAAGTYRAQLIMPINDVVADAPDASPSPTSQVPLASESPTPEPSPTKYADGSTLQLGGSVTLT